MPSEELSYHPWHATAGHEKFSITNKNVPWMEILVTMNPKKTKYETTLRIRWNRYTLEHDFATIELDTRFSSLAKKFSDSWKNVQKFAEDTMQSANIESTHLVEIMTAKNLGDGQGDQTSHINTNTNTNDQEGLTGVDLLNIRIARILETGFSGPPSQHTTFLQLLRTLFFAGIWTISTDGQVGQTLSNEVEENLTNEQIFKRSKELTTLHDAAKKMSGLLDSIPNGDRAGLVHLVIGKIGLYTTEIEALTGMPMMNVIARREEEGELTPSSPHEDTL